MNQERWAEIERIFHSALDLPVDARAGYLARACDGDEELRQEVESLLAISETDSGPIDRPAWEGRPSPQPDQPLAAGSTLGPYQITGVLGEGGMGRVYSARDNRLNRSVAIKVSGSAFGARFQREARAVAALNHPNICTLFDIGPNYLVMELVEGVTLADRIRKGAIPVAEALPIALQIAEAMEAAHERGVLHRDLKPGNVIIKPDGVVKVIDFGLAKGSGPAAGGPETSLSLAGAIMGTPAYMAPEQAEGKPVDRRADIWSFGVVLAEMLTGQRLFTGGTVSATLASVIKDQPDLSKLPPDLQSSVRGLLERCLEKNPKRRLRDIGEARILLEGGASREPAPTQPPGPSRALLAITTVAAVLAAALAWKILAGSPSVPPAPVTRLSLPVPQEAPRDFAISPDGSTLAYSALSGGKRMIWIRGMHSNLQELRQGTEDGHLPFWSPDGRSIGFTADQKLKRVDLTPGALPRVICDGVVGLSGIGGAAWSPTGVILFTSTDGGLYQVAATGGTPARVTKPDRSVVFHRWPFFLSDGNRFLYFAASRGEFAGTLYVSSLKSPQQHTRLVSTRISAVLSHAAGGRPGYLFYSPNGELVAQEFDEKNLRLKGDPIPVADRVAFATARRMQAAVSDNGVLVYGSTPADISRLAWVDRKGNTLSTEGPADVFLWPSLSPDGRRVVMNRDQTGYNAWIYEFGRSALRIATFGVTTLPLWSPGGEWILFGLATDGWVNLYRRRSDGSGDTERITNAKADQSPGSWSPGGIIVYSEVHPETKGDLWMVMAEGDRTPKPLLRSRFHEAWPRLSPDGKWLAYTSDESGREEVYVQAFSRDAMALTGVRWQISTGGGSYPRWRADAGELFFWSGAKVLAAPLRFSTKGLETGTTQELFPTSQHFEPSADGQRILILKDVESEAALTVVTNWHGLLPR